MDSEEHETKASTARVVTKELYGFKTATAESWINFGYALLKLTTETSGQVSRSELDWLLNHLRRNLNVPEKVIHAIQNFDYQAELEEIIPRISANLQLDFPRILLYDSLRMSRVAKNKTSETGQLAIARGALLGVRSDIALTLEGVIELESAEAHTRTGLFKLTTPESLPPTDSQILEISRAGRETYGIDQIDEDSLLAYGRALLAVAGADGKIPKSEEAWILTNMAKFVDEIPIAVNTEWRLLVRTGEFRLLDLDVEIAKINIPTNKLRQLLYDAIKASRADKVYSIEERKAIFRTAKLLKVEGSITLAIENLIAAESSIGRIRRALFQFEI